MSVNNETIIEVSDVSFRFEAQPVLEHISFSIHRGDYVGIVGPNGGGKTTLLRIMLGLLKPDTGQVKFFGTDVSRYREWNRIGYVPQKAIQFDTQFPVTVREVVAMGRVSMRGIGHRLNKTDEERIDEVLGQVDMLEFKDRRVGELSSGQQQRVFIARALASEPEILFLDEPTVGVDVKTQEQFYLLLKRLNETFGITLILVSHDIDILASQANEMTFINGRLVFHGPPHEFNDTAYLSELYGKQIKYLAHDH